MKTNGVYGGCAKHPGQNMVNCSECELEQDIKKFGKPEPPDWMQEMFDKFFRDDVPRLNEMYQMNWIELTLWLQKQADKGNKAFTIEFIYPAGEFHKDSIKITPIDKHKKPLILKDYLD